MDLIATCNCNLRLIRDAVGRWVHANDEKPACAEPKEITPIYDH